MIKNNEKLNLYIFSDMTSKINLIFDNTIESLLEDAAKTYTINDILPVNKYYLPNEFFIYDYLNYPEYVIVIKDSKIVGKNNILQFNQDSMNKKIVDMFGNTINIKMPSDLYKLKAEFNLYKSILNTQNIDIKYKDDKIKIFFDKWYKI